MEAIQYSTEQYTDRGHFAVMTRATVLMDAQLARIADHLRHNAEDLVSTSNPPTIHDCRIAGAMLGWAFDLAPLHIESRFDYSGVPSRARMMHFCPKCDKWRTVPHGQANCEACSSAFVATQHAMSNLPEGTTFLMGC
jgi:hypothetical protein